MPLAIIGLVCPEARVKFKNIDFRTEADFAYYCIAIESIAYIHISSIWGRVVSSTFRYLITPVTAFSLASNSSSSCPFLAAYDRGPSIAAHDSGI